MRRCVAAMLLAATVGCADGKVKADPLDFGRVRSADWIERKLVTDNGDEHTHDFVLSSVSGWCKKAKAVYPKLGSAWNDVLDAIVANPTDAQAQCEAKAAFYTLAAAETQSIYKDGLNAFHMSLLDPNEPVDVPPFEATYPTVGYDDVDRYIIASIHSYESNPYQLFADLADCDNMAWESDAEAALFDIYDVWTLSSGSAEVSKTGDGYDVDLEGALVEGLLANDSAPAAGTMSARGSFAHCEVTWDGGFVERW